MKKSTNRKAAKSLTGLFNEAALQHYNSQQENINDNLNRYFKSLQMASSSATSTPMAKGRQINTLYSGLPAPETEKVDQHKTTEQTGETSRDIPDQQKFFRKVQTARKSIRHSAKSLKQIQKMKDMEIHTSSTLVTTLRPPSETENIETTTILHENMFDLSANDHDIAVGTIDPNRMSSNDAVKIQKETVQNTFRKKQSRKNESRKKQNLRGPRKSLQLLQDEANRFVTYTEDLPEVHSATLVQERQQKLRKRPSASFDSSKSSKLTKHTKEGDEQIQTNRHLPNQMKKRKAKSAGLTEQNHTTESITQKYILSRTSETLSPKKTGQKSKTNKTKTKSKRSNDKLSSPKVNNQQPSLANRTTEDVRDINLFTGNEVTPQTDDSNLLVAEPRKAKSKEADLQLTSPDHRSFIRRQISTIREPIMFSGVIERSFKTSMSGHSSQMKQSVIENVVKKYNKKLLHHGHANSSAVEKLASEAVTLLGKETMQNFPKSFWVQASRDLNFQCPKEIPCEHFANREQFRRYGELEKQICETRQERKNLMDHIQNSVMLLYELDTLKKVGDKMLSEGSAGHLDSQLRATKFRTALNDAKRLAKLFNTKSHD